MEANINEAKTSSSKSHTNLVKSLDFLKRRSFDIKFDLEGTGYTAVEKIGIGAYGVVCSALHSRTGEKVAIKKITGVFEAENVTKRTFREIKILKHFKHDNIISIREILKPREGPNDFQDIYVVLDLMESDLHQIIYSRQSLTEEHIRYFLYQILRGLKYIHSANVIHRDLKPKNLLVRENCHLRIGDFGMARGISSSPSDNKDCYLTLYVATRWYRAPEIMFSLLDYSSAMDMWSVGCIFAEMLGRKHLFPGKYYIEQAQLIVNVLGSPSEKFLSACKSDIIKAFLKQMGKKAPIPWSTLYPKASRRAVDLLDKMLVLHPSDRVTVEQALRHPYFTAYHDQDDEPICVPAFNFDYEKLDMTIPQFREAIYDEILEFHKPKTPEISFCPVLRPAPKTNEAVGSAPVAPSGVGTPPEITEQGVALQAYVRQLRERLKQSSATKGAPECPQGQKPSGESSVSCRYLSEDVVPGSPTDTSSSSTLTPMSCNERFLGVVPSPDDVEMLSAKSTELKMDATSSLSKPEPLPQMLQKCQSPPQGHDPQTSGSDIQTISADTKELIKAALRNASLKKRGKSESKDEGGRPRPVTAAQRQREREDKRRKRKERALKRMKDKKEDVDTEERLSEADRELLERWKNMQTQKASSSMKTAVPLSNEATPTRSLDLHSKQTPHPGLLGSSTQQQTPHPGLLGSSTQQQTPPCRGNTTPSIILCHGNPTQVLHHVAAESGTSSLRLQVEQNNARIGTSESNLKLNTDEDPARGETGRLFSLVPHSHPPADTQFNTLDARGLHLLGLVNLPNGQPVRILGPPDYPPNSLNALLPPASTPNDVSTNPAPLGVFATKRVLLLPSASTASVKNLDGANLIRDGSVPTGMLQPLVDKANNNDKDNSNYEEGKNIPGRDGTSGGLGPKPMTAPGSAIDSPTPSLFDDRPISNRATPDTCFSGTLKWKGDSSNGRDSIVTPGNAFKMAVNKNPKPAFPLPSTSSASASVKPSGEPMLSGTPGQAYPNAIFENQFTCLPTIQVSSSSEGGNRNRLHEEKVLPMPTAEASTGEGSCDLITALSKQLSKYQVEDPVPPALALTPKGNGDGYGVGLDLDTFTTENMADKNDCNRFISPLSPSLLANWMDVTANMDIQGLERELELSMMSPMALSYTDLRLYSS